VGGGTEVRVSRATSIGRRGKKGAAPETTKSFTASGERKNSRWRKVSQNGGEGLDERKTLKDGGRTSSCIYREEEREQNKQAGPKYCSYEGVLGSSHEDVLGQGYIKKPWQTIHNQMDQWEMCQRGSLSPSLAHKKGGAKKKKTRGKKGEGLLLGTQR